MGLIFGMFYALPYLGIFLWCRERVPIPVDKERFSIKKVVSPLKVKTFRSLIGMYLIAFFVMDVVSAVFAYFMTYLIQREDLLELVLGTMLIVQIVMLPLVVILSEKIGKPKTFMVGAGIFILGSIALGFYSNTWPIASIFVISGVVGVGIICCIMMPWMMYPDVTDISTLAFGERRSGAFAGIMTFLRKFSAAIGIWLVGLILQFTGYIAPGDIILPIDASAQIVHSGEISVNLAGDDNEDISINMKKQLVTPVSGQQVKYEFSGDILTIWLPGDEKPRIIVEDGLEITQAYDFSPESTMKSVKKLNQSTSFITGLRVIVFVIPVVLMLLVIFIASRYPLTQGIHQRLNTYYKSEEKDADEEAELKRLLIGKNLKDKKSNGS